MTINVCLGERVGTCGTSSRYLPSLYEQCDTVQVKTSDLESVENLALPYMNTFFNLYYGKF